MTEKEMKDLRELVEYLKSAGIGEFELESADQKIRLKFAGAAGAGIDSAALSHLLAQATAAGAMHHVAPAALVPAGAAAPAVEAVESGLHEVKSPMVGTFYESPSPGAAAFVKPGDHVTAGQVLCIVEAMKLMNEIEADVSGEVVKRIANDGQPVEYGQPLYLIRP
jgi:acetyl-CoA carboxylase biotin carboxyl carrier protein